MSTGLPVTLFIIACAVILYWPTVESVLLSIQKETRNDCDTGVGGTHRVVPRADSGTSNDR